MCVYQSYLRNVAILPMMGTALRALLQLLSLFPLASPLLSLAKMSAKSPHLLKNCLFFLPRKKDAVASYSADISHLSLPPSPFLRMAAVLAAAAAATTLTIAAAAAVVVSATATPAAATIHVLLFLSAPLLVSLFRCSCLCVRTRSQGSHAARRASALLLFLPVPLFFLPAFPSFSPPSHVGHIFAAPPHPPYLSPSRHLHSSSPSSTSFSPSFSPHSSTPPFFSLLFLPGVAAIARSSDAGDSVAAAVPPVAIEVKAEDREERKGNRKGERKREQALPTFEALYSAASSADFSSWLVKIRRELHAWPELKFQEFRTSALIQRTLDALHIPYTTGWGKDIFAQSSSSPTAAAAAGDAAAIAAATTAEAEASKAAAAAEAAAGNKGEEEEKEEEEGQKRRGSRQKGTGVVAHLGTGGEPCVALRADMDALPIQEKGTVRLIFQPAEEGGAGARCMREENVLQMFPPARLIFGHHVIPSLPTGALATRRGVLLAGASEFAITLKGKGGHAAMPAVAVDPAPAVAALLQAIYAIGSRETSFDEEGAGLISVTQIHGGTAMNVIPAEYEMRGTIRALTLATLSRLQERLQQTAASIAKAFRCESDIWVNPRAYPPTVNHPEATDLYMQIAKPATTPPKGEVETHAAVLGAEDFAFFLEQVPGVFAFIGIGSGGDIPDHPATNHPLHSDFFALDERVLSRGAALEAHVALCALQQLHAANEGRRKQKREKDEEEEEEGAHYEEVEREQKQVEGKPEERRGSGRRRRRRRSGGGHAVARSDESEGDAGGGDEEEEAKVQKQPRGREERGAEGGETAMEISEREEKEQEVAQGKEYVEQELETDKLQLSEEL